MKYLTFFAILFSIESFSQNNISRSDLKGEWFSANNDSTFFTADTIQLIKRTNKELIDDIRKSQKSYLEPESELTQSPSYVNLDFKNKQQFKFWESTRGGAYGSVWTIPMKWKLENDTITVTSEKFTWRFQVITIYGIDKVEFDILVSNYPKNQFKTLTTPVITVKKIKN